MIKVQNYLGTFSVFVWTFSKVRGVITKIQKKSRNFCCFEIWFKKSSQLVSKKRGGGQGKIVKVETETDFVLDGFLSRPTNCSNFLLVTQQTPSVHKKVSLLYSTKWDLCTVSKVCVSKVIIPRLTDFACKSFYIWSGPLLHGMASCRQLKVVPHQPDFVLCFGHY